MSLGRILIAALPIVVACSSQSEVAVSKNVDPRPSAAKEQDQSAKQEARAPLFRRDSLPEAPVPAVDPARVAIEEDFADEAAQRITKRSNLELELDRLSKEIAAAPR